MLLVQSMKPVLIAAAAIGTAVSKAVSAAAPAATAAAAKAAGWPDGPLVTSGRWLHNAAGGKVTYAGANWPGHGEVMIPEGLQYQSISAIVGKVKALGMNAIRLTYAIQMVDELFAHGGARAGADVSIKVAFERALGVEQGKQVLDKVLKQNPTFTPETTRLQVFDAVAAEAAKQQVYVHLDNHVSEAKWCCGGNDGNGWFGQKFFHVGNWTRGLGFMAAHVKTWPALTSMSLRNELRPPPVNEPTHKTYNWETWYRHVREGVKAIHAANPSPLIFLSGLNYDTTLAPVVHGEPLTPGKEIFSPADFGPAADKLVLELHNYQRATKDCPTLEASLNHSGFCALDGCAAGRPIMPVVLSEWGFPQDGLARSTAYVTCLHDWLARRDVGWFYWSMAASYYIRQGTLDKNDPWALLTHDWSAWRDHEFATGAMKQLCAAMLP